MLLKDLKANEEICIKKYDKYANQAQCQQLKQLFNSLGQQEQQHLNTLNQIEVKRLIWGNKDRNKDSNNLNNRTRRVFSLVEWTRWRYALFRCSHDWKASVQYL